MRHSRTPCREGLQDSDMIAIVRDDNMPRNHIVGLARAFGCSELPCLSNCIPELSEAAVCCVND